MLILHCDICGLEGLFEGLKGSPGVTGASAGCAVKLDRRVQLRRVGCKVTGGYECVHANASAHYVVSNFVYEWIPRPRFRKFHVRIMNCFQSCVK